MSDCRDEGRVVVAMSGGVDSSLAAALLVDQGYEVTGVSMRLAPDDSRVGSSGCCSQEDFEDAACVAAELGVPHYVFDMRERFRRSVMQPFADEYLAGRTPSPCVLCNRELKFDLLRRKARELGISLVATGHYARRDRVNGRYRLRRAADEFKDQSYFLFEMGQEELADTLFPVGDLTKDSVRRLASEKRLVVAAKPESQEICFVPDGHYAEVVQRLRPEGATAGSIIDETGRVLGRHDGVHRFTVGQRRGLGISAPLPLYVSAIDAMAGTVTVSPRGNLLRAGLEASALSWTSGEASSPGCRISVKIRYRHPAVAATLEAVDHDRARVVFDHPQEAVAPGQAAVFYLGDEVLGGGWIDRALTLEEAA
ncbi:MAG: tRNA 2-thiouridine(34) synthase MnmA [Candidatus Binatia bacterium]